MHETKLSTALRSANQSDTQTFLVHRSSLRRTMIRILAEIDNSTWTMRDDELLDLAEAWLKERIHRGQLPRAAVFNCEPLPTVEGS
jgi:hypothetical protein